MTLAQAVKEVFPTPEEERTALYTVAHPDNYPADLITRIQRGAYIASME